ncbi:MAG: H-type lectin domain-containing protein [Ignavibacteriaceae bacterium]
MTSLLALLILSSNALFAQTQIQSGKFSANSSVQGYTLDQNSGDRSMTINITFVKSFDKKPDVTLSVIMLDADTKSSIRYNVEASSVSRDGFSIKISTWSDTKILGIAGNWMAHSE